MAAFSSVSLPWSMISWILVNFDANFVNNASLLFFCLITASRDLVCSLFAHLYSLNLLTFILVVCPLAYADVEERFAGVCYYY